MFAKRVKSICSAVLILSVFLLSFSMPAGAAEETKFSAFGMIGYGTACQRVTCQER